jgi:hypothetical protein
VTKDYTATISDNAKRSMMYFIQVGTKTTKRLGAGERAGVLNSYRAAYSKLPGTLSDWQDIIKIANGRWPKAKSASAEKDSQDKFFKKIYKRSAALKNANDNAAVSIISYGLRPGNRNTASEAAAVKIFKGIFSYNPTSAVDWDIVRAIAYSGSKR